MLNTDMWLVLPVFSLKYSNVKTSRLGKFPGQFVKRVERNTNHYTYDKLVHMIRFRWLMCVKLGRAWTLVGHQKKILRRMQKLFLKQNMRRRKTDRFVKIKPRRS